MCGKIAFEADMELRVGFIQCGAFGTSSSWTCVASLLEHAVVFSLQTPGINRCLGSSVDAPRLWSAAPLSLISLQTLALGLSLMEKENLFLFSLGPWSIVCFRCKGFSCCLFFFVTCGVAAVWPLTAASVDISKVELMQNTHQCTQLFYPLIRKCIFYLSSASKQKQLVLYEGRSPGSTTLCNWFSKPESSEIAAHMELNCAVQPYRHSHNPLPILQQARLTN